MMGKAISVGVLGVPFLVSANDAEVSGNRYYGGADIWKSLDSYSQTTTQRSSVISALLHSFAMVGSAMFCVNV